MQIMLFAMIAIYRRSALLRPACLALMLTAAGLQAQTPAPAAPAPAAKYDFGDFTSATLTAKAWKANADKDYAGVDAYTGKCIEMFQAKAIEMQASLESPAPADKANEYWALNDVGTCLFLRGQALQAQGKTEAAVAAYKTLVDKLAYAQCWDPKGWFWKPADAARGQLKTLEFGAL